MKSILSTTILAFTFALHLSIKAQTTPEALLSQLPPIPKVECTADTSEINRFTDKIYQVKSDLKEVVDRIQAKTQSNIEKNKIISTQIKQSGLSKSDLQKLQESDGSEELGRKVADKIVSEQYGVSLQDFEKVGEMSDADQEKWAENYANNMMQKAKQNPQATIKKQDKSARLFELAKEQKTIGERITSKMARITRIFKDAEEQDTIETRILNGKLRPLEKQLCSGICTDAEIARSHAAEKQIYDLRLRYCEKMSSLQTNAIAQYLTTLKLLFPDYRELTKVQDEISRLRLGVINPEDLSSYSAVEEYANILLDAYKYWVGKFRQ